MNDEVEATGLARTALDLTWKVDVNGTTFAGISTKDALTIAGAALRGDRILSLTLDSRVVIITGELAVTVSADIPLTVPADDRALLLQALENSVKGSGEGFVGDGAVDDE